MIEIPESLILAKQLNQALKGRTVTGVFPWQSPHKLAFINGDPATYDSLFNGKTFEQAYGFGSWVEMKFGDSILAVSEGTGLFYTNDEIKLPKKHQMLLKFDDGSFLCAYVKMYGAVVGAKVGEYDNKYYLVAREKPSVFSEDFSPEYFNTMLKDEGVQKLSIKAFLATGQRIPGIGNGVLQDILFNSKIHPREKVKNISKARRENLFKSMLSTLREMTESGGRDTDKDLFGNNGGYITKMSKNTVNKPCPVCNTGIVKASYMGGSIYFCSTCQPLQ
jgi:formamidopyrimidine-DNA glycosylase